jgi:hypothetical protein
LFFSSRNQKAQTWVGGFEKCTQRVGPLMREYQPGRPTKTKTTQRLGRLTVGSTWGNMGLTYAYVGSWRD